MERLQRIAGNRLLDIAMAALTFMCLVRLALALPERAHRIDFAHYYASSRTLLETGRPYGVDLEPMYQRFGFDVPEEIRHATNPPSLLWLFAPFAWLPPAGAFIAWTLVQALALAAILWQTKRLLAGRLSDRAWRFVCCGVISSHPVYWHFCFSQTQLLLAALVLAAFAWHRHGKHTHACLAVTAAGLLKLFPFILLPWFVWRGRWKSASITLVAGAAAVLLTGIPHWIAFFRQGYPLVTSWTLGHPYNSSLPALLVNLISPPGAETLNPVWWPVAGLLGAILLAVAYLVCRQGRGDAELEFSLLSVAMLAGSLVSWGHYLVFLIFPVAVWITHLANNPTPGRIAAFAMALAFFSVGPQQNAFLNAHPHLNVVVNWMPLYGLLVMGGALVSANRDSTNKTRR
jgi:hypothetical protein